MTAGAVNVLARPSHSGLDIDPDADPCGADLAWPGVGTGPDRPGPCSSPIARGFGAGPSNRRPRAAPSPQTGPVPRTTRGSEARGCDSDQGKVKGFLVGQRSGTDIGTDTVSH